MLLVCLRKLFVGKSPLLKGASDFVPIGIEVFGLLFLSIDRTGDEVVG